MVGHNHEEEAVIGHWLEWETTVLKATNNYMKRKTLTYYLQNAVKVALSIGKLTEELATALAYLDQQLAANNGVIVYKAVRHTHFSGTLTCILLQESVSLAEIVIWATLLVCLSHESSLYSGKQPTMVIM